MIPHMQYVYRAMLPLNCTLPMPVDDREDESAAPSRIAGASPGPLPEESPSDLDIQDEVSVNIPELVDCPSVTILSYLIRVSTATLHSTIHIFPDSFSTVL